MKSLRWTDWAILTCVALANAIGLYMLLEIWL